MPIPTWSVGQVLTAADVNSWFVPLVAVKVNDTSRASNATQGADPELVVSVPGAGTYAVDVYLNYEGGTSGSSDLLFSISTTAGWSLRYQTIGVNPAGNLILSTTSGGPVNNNTIQTAVPGVVRSATLRGSVVATGSGTITFNWAQGTSNATPTIVHAQSYMMLRRIS